MDLGRRQGRKREGGARRIAVRHRGHLPDVEAVGRKHTCDGLYQRQPHDAVRHRRAALGRRAVRVVRRAAKHAAESVRVGASFRIHGRERGRREDRDLGGRRRSAGGAVRAALHRKGRHQKHLRYGLLYVDEHRHRAHALKARLDHDARRGRRRTKAAICSRGQRVCRRSGDTMASRRAQDDRDVRRDRADRAQRPRHGWSLYRPCVHRARRAALGRARARHCLRHYARHGQGALCQSGARIDRLSGGRRHARDGERCRIRHQMPRGRRRSVRQQLLDAVPGGRARLQGGASGGHREHRARRGVSCGTHRGGMDGR